MKYLRCPYCEGMVRSLPKSYKCKCGLNIWKNFHGKNIDLNIVSELLEKGQTSILEGFYSPGKGKHYSAGIVLQDKRLVLDFPKNSKKPHNLDKSEEPTSRGDTETARYNKLGTNDELILRVQSARSGIADIIITGAINKVFTGVGYGHVNRRTAECLACISAIRIIKQALPTIKNQHITLSINDSTFASYMLKESKPRDAPAKQILSSLWVMLNSFAGWKTTYERKIKTRLEGSPQAPKFPKGIFPQLEVKVSKEVDHLVIQLPSEPDIQHQFQASINAAKQDNTGRFILPVSIEKTLNVWVTCVRGGE